MTAFIHSSILPARRLLRHRSVVVNTFCSRRVSSQRFDESCNNI